MKKKRQETGYRADTQLQRSEQKHHEARDTADTQLQGNEEETPENWGYS
jgi:hypothetical protein